MLQRKYDHAKRIIHELSRHEQLLAVQLRERDQEYNSHLRLLKSRVQQLENELATTQKFAGIPVQLPYESLPGHGGNGNLSPPELLKQPPVSFFYRLIVMWRHLLIDSRTKLKYNLGLKRHLLLVIETKFNHLVIWQNLELKIRFLRVYLFDFTF